MLDTETTTDHGQALLFGSLPRVRGVGRLRQEGLDRRATTCPTADLATLRRYVATHAADSGGRLRLRSRREFLREVFWPIAYKAQARVVRLQPPVRPVPARVGLATAAQRRLHASSCSSRSTTTAAGGRTSTARRSRVKSLGSKRNFISFTQPARLDAHLRQAGRRLPRAVPRPAHARLRLHRPLALARRAAATSSGSPRARARPSSHGVITPEYIDYNRQDVRLTWQLYQALMAEWRRHPIDLAPEQAYSPAAVSKAYLRAAGVTPPAERSRRARRAAGPRDDRLLRRPDRVPDPRGAAARAVRRLHLDVPDRVRLAQGLWDVGDGRAPDERGRDRRGPRAARPRSPASGSTTRRSGRPSRACSAGSGRRATCCRCAARYGADGDRARRRGRRARPPPGRSGSTRSPPTPTSGTPSPTSSSRGCSGDTTPTIIEAFRIVPVGQLPGLQRRQPARVDRRSDPARDDLFRLATEERARLKADPTLSDAERERLTPVPQDGRQRRRVRDLRRVPPARPGARGGRSWSGPRPVADRTPG